MTPSVKEKDMDKGYAWVILVASFFAQVGSVGFSLGGIGVMMISFEKAFPDSHISSRALISSLRISIQFLSSLLVVPLFEKLGFRVVSIGGSLLAAGAIIATAYATELWHVYLLYGVLAGFGIACPYTASITLLGEYFDRLKHIAFPVVALGQAVGVLAFPPILQVVVDAQGHRVALGFMASCMILDVLCSLLFKRNDGRTLLQSWHPCGQDEAREGKVRDLGSEEGAQALPNTDDKVEQETCTRNSQDANLSDAGMLLLPDGGETASSLLPRSPDKMEAAESAVLPAGQVQPCCGGVLASSVVWALLRRWTVWSLVLNSLLWGACAAATQALLPSLAFSHNLSGDTVALGITMGGVGMLASSLIIMSLGKRAYDRYLLNLLSASLYGLCPLFLSLHVIKELYITLFAVSGWWLGTLLSLANGVLFESTKDPGKQFSKLIGLYYFTNGIGCFIGPIVVGNLSESFGEVVGWSVCGCFGIAASLMMMPAYIRRRHAIKEKAKKPALLDDTVVNNTAEECCAA